MQGFELNFFLGGLSPIGFQGYYARSLPPAGTGRAVLIKAGPGCGKSHLMRTLARRLTAAGHTAVSYTHLDVYKRQIYGGQFVIKRAFFLDRDIIRHGHIFHTAHARAPIYDIFAFLIHPVPPLAVPLQYGAAGWLCVNGQ